ncbi:Hypothetical protein KVN_LOCUS385 [uncultured virus]|nr:Hypothetical protein KVN_LOCUS385 [uncultured virus]
MEDNNDLNLKKCEGFSKNLNKCNKYVEVNDDYCQKHQYFKDFSAEQINKIKNNQMESCDICGKWREPDEFKRCNICRNKLKKKYYNQKPRCQLEGCKFKENENGYCGKHQLIYWKMEQEKDGKFKVCHDYVRGCKSVLDKNSTFSKCDGCREKYRIKDKQNRLNLQKENDSIKNEILKNNNINMIYEIEKEMKCKNCKVKKLVKYFKNLKGDLSKNCQDCLEKQRIIDRKRIRHRNWKEEMNKNPKRKMKKEKWKEENYDKVAGYWINARTKKINELGIDEYLKKNADYAKQYRSKNPEYVQKTKENKKVNIEVKYNYYKHRSEDHGIIWELTFDDSKKYFLGKCYYCGDMACEGVLLNGIDRKNNYLGYTIDNCTCCCTFCNMIKSDLFDDKQFINICEHILTNLKLINGNLYPNNFKNYKSSDYNSYKTRSENKKLYWTINEKIFQKIICNPCYICGKLNSENHRNGIDRICSGLGYDIDNCRSCCGTCNYMKNKYELYDILEQLLKIYKYNNEQDKNDTENEIFNFKKYLEIIKPYDLDMIILNQEVKIKQININDDQPKIRNRIKLTKEQIKERFDQKKQIKKQELFNKYNDDNYKKEWKEKLKNIKQANTKIKTNDYFSNV